jgi:small subunit ribosomal protein S6
MRNYEVMTIHRPELAEADVRSKITEIEDLLRARGAEITDSDFWGKRRFAYEINHIHEGYYSVVEFDLETEGNALEDLDRALSLSDAVVRHKVIRRDNR